MKIKIGVFFMKPGEGIQFGIELLTQQEGLTSQSVSSLMAREGYLPLAQYLKMHSMKDIETQIIKLRVDYEKQKADITPLRTNTLSNISLDPLGTGESYWAKEFSK